MSRRRGMLALAAGTAFLQTFLASCAHGAPRLVPPREPAPGGTLRLADQAPHSLDPVAADSVYESLPVNQIFDGLVDVDGTLSIVPRLARSWIVSRDGRTYTFSLRPGVKFHDGSQFSSEDVLFTFRRLLSPARQQMNVACGYLGVIRGASAFMAGQSPTLPGVRVLGPLELRIELERPYASFLEVLAMDGLRIVPRSAVTRMGDDSFGRTPVGTGPFRLLSWTKERLLLAGYANHFAGPPHLDQIEIQFLRPSEPDSGAGRFLRGELDVLQVSSGVVAQIAQRKDLQVVRYPELSLTFLGLNTRERGLVDVRVRRAITHALDRDALLYGKDALEREASGILPPGLIGYVPATQVLEHDPALARRLLREAGHPDGRGLAPLDVYASAGSPSAPALLERLRLDLASIGIEVRSHQVSWEELSRRLDGKQAPAFLLTWVADLADPDSFLTSLFQSGGPANFFALADREADRLLREGALETDPLRRGQIYRRAETHLLELAPLVPVSHSVRMLALGARIHGLAPGPLGLANAWLENVWFEPEPRS